MNVHEAIIDYNQGLDNDANSALTTQEKKWTLLAGKAAFSLESYIFRSVLPASMVKPYIFPRTIADMESFLTINRTADLQEATLQWDKLKTSLNWCDAHEQVISSAKQSYLMIKPSPEMLKELNEECRYANNATELHKALKTVLPIHLRDSGDEVAAIIMKLGLT